MKINWEKVLMTAILITMMLLLLTSCGSRKVNKTEIKETEKTEVKEVTQTKTDVTDNTKIIDTSTSDEIEIVPIDNSKPIVVNGKSFFNVKIKRKKSKNNITTQKNIIVAKNEQKEVKTASVKQKVIEVKQIERKNNYWWILLFLLLIPIYFGYKKFKQYI